LPSLSVRTVQPWWKPRVAFVSAVLICLTVQLSPPSVEMSTDTVCEEARPRLLLR
jgi:hypothetical protein